jgi:hypothetical protein
MVVEPVHLNGKDTTSCSTTIVEQKKVAPVCHHDRCPCPGGWRLFDGHYYLFVKNDVNWTEAEKDCKNKGAHLASIHSAAENTFLYSLWSGSGSYLCMGGTDAAVEVGFAIYLYNSYICYKVKAP